MLVDEGFETLGQVMPPVSMHFSELPMTLVVSPRDQIEFAAQLELNALPVDQRAALESTIDTRLDVSSLVVPLGGSEPVSEYDRRAGRRAICLRRWRARSRSPLTSGRTTI